MESGDSTKYLPYNHTLQYVNPIVTAAHDDVYVFI